MEKHIHDQLVAMITHLSTRRNMYIPDERYLSLAAFIMGYLLSVRDITRTDPSEQFQRWLQKKQGRGFSVHWSHYILMQMAANDEEKASALLLELFAAYLADARVEE